MNKNTIIVNALLALLALTILLVSLFNKTALGSILIFSPAFSRIIVLFFFIFYSTKAYKQWKNKE